MMFSGHFTAPGRSLCGCLEPALSLFGWLVWEILGKNYCSRIFPFGCGDSQSSTLSAIAGTFQACNSNLPGQCEGYFLQVLCLYSPPPKPLLSSSSGWEVTVQGYIACHVFDQVLFVDGIDGKAAGISARPATGDAVPTEHLIR